MDETPSDLVWQTQQPLVIHDLMRETRYRHIMRALEEHGVRSCCVLPLTTAQRRLGAMGLGDRRHSDRLATQAAARAARARVRASGQQPHHQGRWWPAGSFAAICSTDWTWPGNVRELENFIERAVILSGQHAGSALRVPLAELRNGTDPVAPTPLSTLEDAEREHILRALRECRWLVGGPAGAAARLGLKRTTLQSRMLKLRIGRQTP